MKERVVNKSRKALCCENAKERHCDMHETLPLSGKSTHNIEINSLQTLLLLLRKLNCSRWAYERERQVGIVLAQPQRHIIIMSWLGFATRKGVKSRFDENYKRAKLRLRGLGERVAFNNSNIFPLSSESIHAAAFPWRGGKLLWRLNFPSIRTLYWIKASPQKQESVNFPWRKTNIDGRYGYCLFLNRESGRIDWIWVYS